MESRETRESFRKPSVKEDKNAGQTRIVSRETFRRTLSRHTGRLEGKAVKSKALIAGRRNGDSSGTEVFCMISRKLTKNIKKTEKAVRRHRVRPSKRRREAHPDPNFKDHSPENL